MAVLYFRHCKLNVWVHQNVGRLLWINIPSYHFFGCIEQNYFSCSTEYKSKNIFCTMWSSQAVEQTKLINAHSTCILQTTTNYTIFKLYERIVLWFEKKNYAEHKNIISLWLRIGMPHINVYFTRPPLNSNRFKWIRKIFWLHVWL